MSSIIRFADAFDKADLGFVAGSLIIFVSILVAEFTAPIKKMDHTMEQQYPCSPVCRK
jgi:hypothetical protein